MATVLERYKDPRYTGANRCTRCTGVNAVLAVLLAALVGANVSLLVSEWAGVVAAVSVLAFATVAIYFRGYLIPGTPELTKRYFPETLLGWFGKANIGQDRDNLEDEDGVEDIEELFLRHGLLEFTPDETDLQVTAEFRERWRTAIPDRPAAEAALAELLDEEPSGVTFHEPVGQETIRATGSDGGLLTTWPSGAALRADAGAGLALDDAPWFMAEAPRTRADLLRSLRLFVEVCPDCGGGVSITEETVESCCSSYEVYAATCGDCGARLIELRE